MNNLSSGNISRSILKLALPLIGTSFLQFANNIVDMFWVGKLGSNAVSAVGVTGFYIHLVWAISSIVTVGAGISISHALGAKKEELAQRIARQSMLAAWVFALLITVVLQASSGFLQEFFGLDDACCGIMFQEYFFWMSFGLIFTHTTNLLTSISMSRGDSKTPFRLRTMGILLNMVLTPTLMYGLDMGISGAAISTFAAQALVALLFMVKFSSSFFGNWKGTLKQTDLLGKVFKLGISPSVQRIIFSLASIVIGKIVADWGESAIAAQKIGHQLEAMTFMTIGGLSGAMMAFVGQNYGAQRIDRIKEAYRSALKMAVAFGLLMTAVLIGQAENLIRLFVQDTETVAIGVKYLQIVGLSQVFMVVEMLTSSIINGMGKTEWPARINIVVLLLRIPMALWLSTPERLGIDGVWWTIFITTFMRSIAMLVLYDKTIKNYQNLQSQTA